MSLRKGARQRATIVMGRPMVSILEELIPLVERRSNDFIYSTWDGAQEAVAELRTHISRLRDGTFNEPDELEVLFLPTGPLQEVSFSGWTEEYHRLAGSFDVRMKMFRLVMKLFYPRDERYKFFRK